MYIEKFVFPEYVEKDEEVSNDTYGRFYIYPFEKGWATTIGNSLRRALLSGVPGAAVIMVRIEGVDHEFSTIEGVYEDVVDIILNVKKLVLRLRSDEPQRLVLSVKGKGDYTASDIKPNPYVDILNPDLHLFTITGEKTAINMEMIVDKGWGYVPVEHLKIKELEPGMIPIDAFFSPVKKANFSVEQMRYGNRMDYEKLTIEVWTNGVVTPEEAFYIAGEHLKKSIENILVRDKEKEAVKDIIFKLREFEYNVDELTPEKVADINILDDGEKERLIQYLRRKENET